MSLLLYGAAAVAVGVAYKLYSWARRNNAAAVFEREEEQRRLDTAAQLRCRGDGQLLDRLLAFRGEIKGSMTLPTDEVDNGERYHAWRRRPFNQSQRGFPLVVVRVSSAQEVSACLRFLQSLPSDLRQSLPVNVICGGHSSKCMMDGAFVIDLFLLKTVSLQREAMTVSVEGGAYLEEIDKVMQPFNVAVPVGTYPQTGVAGLALGGGFGWLARKHGLCVDHLLEAEVVLPTGELVVANERENRELLWGLRGGSGNFGVVTKFVFRIHQLPRYCLSGMVVYLAPTLASALEVCVNFDHLLSTMSNDTEGLLVFPAGSPVIPTMWGHFGDESDPTRVPDLQRGANLGGWLRLENSVKVSSYHQELQRATTKLVMSGHVYHTLIQFGSVDQPMPREFFEQVLKLSRQSLPASMEKASFIMFPLGGAVRTCDPEGELTCVPVEVRQARYFGIFEAYWKPEFNTAGKAAARKWCHDILEVIRPHCTEVLRYAAADNTADLEKDTVGYANSQTEKLGRLKYRFDPHNVLQHNTNILPVPPTATNK